MGLTDHGENKGPTIAIKRSQEDQLKDYSAMSLSGAQRLCMAVIIVGFIVSLTGYVSPYWEYISVDAVGGGMSYELGLIFGCYSITVATQTTSECDVIAWDAAAGDNSNTYFKAVRILMGVSLFFGLCSSLAGLVLCCRTNTPSVLNASVFALGAGIAGIAGVATFAICSKGDIKTLPVAIQQHLLKGWSFYMSAAGAGLMALFGILTPLVPKQKQQYISSTVQGNQMTPTKGYGRFY